MKKIGIFLLVFAISTVIFSGCGKETSDEKVIGVTIYKFDDYFMSFVRKVMEESTDSTIELVMKDSENSQNKQNEQVDQMISKGIDVLAINLVDPKAAPIIIKKAKKAKIPLIFFNKEPVKTDLDSYDNCWYVGTNSMEAGIIQGQIIVNSWQEHPEWDKNGDGKIQYVLLKGEPGHPDAEARSKYSISTIIDSGISVEELGNQTAMWDSVQAKEAMDEFLKISGDKIEYVISNNDSMALGALVSLQAAGYFSNDLFMPVIGFDAIPDVLTKIKSGLIVGTVLNDAVNQGNAIIDMSRNLANKKPPLNGMVWALDAGKALRIPHVAITIKNVSEWEKAYE